MLTTLVTQLIYKNLVSIFLAGSIEIGNAIP
jgi:hypothetical protein